MLARVVAFIVAVAMVAGALAYRDRENGGGGTDGPSAQEVVCALELGAACNALPEATVEPVAATVDRLMAVDAGERSPIAAWVTPGAWPAIVDSGRQRPLFERGRALAHTPLVAVVKKDAAPCTPLTWNCLGQAAQQQSFRLAGDPANEATGVFVRAALLGGLLGPNYATNDLDENPDARPWLGNVKSRMAEASQFGAPDLSRFLLVPAAQVFVTTGAAATSARNVAAVDVVSPAPTATIPAVLAIARGGEVDVDTGRLRDALAEAGWTAGPPSGDDGLPSPGVLFALREEIE